MTEKVNQEINQEYLSTKKLCYGCLKPISKTYTARNCNQRDACKVCNEKHSTSLYVFKLRKNPITELPTIHLTKVARYKMEF